MRGGKTVKLDQIMNDEGIMDGIMLWVGAVIVIVIMLPVINGVINSAPKYVTGSLDVGNLSGGGGTYTEFAIMNTTQTNIISGVGNSYNIIAIIPTIVAAIVILGVVALLGMRRGGGQ